MGEKGTPYPPLESFPPLGYCETCLNKQYETPHGPSCKHGHGGAGTLTEPEMKKEYQLRYKRSERVEYEGTGWYIEVVPLPNWTTEISVVDTSGYTVMNISLQGENFDLEGMANRLLKIAAQMKRNRDEFEKLHSHTDADDLDPELQWRFRDE